ncbi:MAG: hypothetical protein V1711_02660 [bacterium]
MRKFLSISFITLALITCAVGAAPTAHAQECTGGVAGSGLDSGKCFDANGEEIVGVTPTEPEEATLTEPASSNAVSDGTKNPSTLPPSPPTEASLNGVMAYIAQLFAWLFGVSLVLLDNVVYYTVITMGNYISHLSAIGVTWRIMRDIGNITLIFGFLAVGISTILNTERFGWKTKMLPMLLVSAVFLNFSLFISEAVIDTGNLFATQFYTQINGGQPAGAKEITEINKEGISNRIMSNLGLQTIYGEIRDPAKADIILKQSFTIGFMSIILFMVAAFVVFSLAFILIARFIILIFLIISAPIGFAGLAIPKLSSMASKWWSELFSQTITAPVLLLLLYVALAIITDTAFLTGFSDCIPGAESTVTTSCSNPSYIGFSNGNFYGFASVILSFIVAMGLLLAVTVFSKKLSAFGAGWATRTAGALSFGATAYGVSALTGGAARLGRARVQHLNPTSRFGRGAQRLASRGLRAAEGVRMDIRSIPGVGAGLTAGGANEIARPIERSAAGRASQAIGWIRHGGDAANAQMAQETRIRRLIAALNPAHPDLATARGLMRTVTDDELRQHNIENLITTNPLAVQVLTNHQVTVLPDNIMTTPNVFQNLTIGQLEAYRAAGNAAPGAAGAPMQVWLATNQYDPVYMAGRNPADQIAIRAFWHI